MAPLMTVFYGLLLLGAVVLGARLWVFLNRENAKHARQRSVERMTDRRLEELRTFVDLRQKVDAQYRDLLAFAYAGAGVRLAEEIGKFETIPVAVAHYVSEITGACLRNNEFERMLDLSPVEKSALREVVNREVKRLEPIDTA